MSGRVFAAVTVGPTLVTEAWLVPGTGFLLAGRLLPVPMVIAFGALAVAVGYFALRAQPAGWPRFGGAEAGVPFWALAFLVVIAAGFGAWQAFFRSEQIFGANGPGVYLQYGYWIAGHGTARIPVSATAFGGTVSGGAGGLRFATTGFSASGGFLLPSALPGLPLVLAGGVWLGGVGGALLAPAVLGGCAVLSFGGLVGRLCGAWPAVAAELVLAVCLPEVYTARAPFAEPLVQVLLLGGLCLFADSLVTPPRDGGGLALAGLGGLALGLTVLASAESLAALLPVLPVLGVLAAARRAQALPFGAGLAAGAGAGLTAGWVLARPYLAALAGPLHLIGWCAVGFAAVSLLAVPLAFPGVRSPVRRACAFNVRFGWFGGETGALPSLGGVAQWLALVLPAVALVGLAERPYLHLSWGAVGPAVSGAVASLQRLEHLPGGGLRQYYESSLSWVFWYLGVPAVLLACAGAAALGRRAVSAALTGRCAASSAVWLWGLPVLVVSWSAAAVLWDPAVVPWQPLASRRLVPSVLPGLLLLAVWASSWLTSRASLLGASRAAAALVAGCCMLALAVPPLATTLNPGLAARPTVGRRSSGLAKLVSRVRLRGVGATATYGGSLAAVSSLCAAIGPSASILFTSPATAAGYAPAVRDLCGQPAAWVSAPSAAASAVLQQAVTAIERAGRRPVLLGPSRSSVSLGGGVPREVVALRTSGDAEELAGAPAGTWPTTYTLWLAVPTQTNGVS